MLSSADAVRCERCGTYFTPPPPSAINLITLAVGLLLAVGVLVIIVAVVDRPIAILFLSPFVIMFTYASQAMIRSAIRGLRGDPNARRGFEVRSPTKELPPNDSLDETRDRL